MRDDQPEKEETIGFTHETFFLVFFTKVWSLGDFPGGPMIKTSNAGSVGSIPGQGAKILQASWPKNQNIKQKQYYHKVNKDF